MDAEIHPDVELALRKQVERAVRPVRAGRDRKLVMREELMAHLTEIYTEELAKQPDEQPALTAALERFGKPGALTAELDASVGWAGRYAYYEEFSAHWFSPYRGEPLFRFALRCSLALGLLNLTVFAFAAFVDSWFVRIGLDDPTGLRLLPLLCLLLIAGQVATVVAAWSVSRALSRDSQLPRWIRAMAFAFGWSLVVMALLALFWWSVTGTLSGFKRVAGRAAVWGPAGLAVAYGPLPGFLLLAGWILHAVQKQRERYEVWTTLEIGA